MRAAEVVLNLGDDARRTSTEITRTRMAMRELEGSVSGLIRPAEQVAPELSEDGRRAQSEQRELLQARLGQLFTERRRLGAPLPPPPVGPEAPLDSQPDEDPDALGVAGLG